MPTINEVIERVERVKPMVNVDDRDRARWLLDLDGRVWREVIEKSEPVENQPQPPKAWPEDGDKPLLVGPPYDRIYDLWLIAMLEFTTREYGNYNNTVLLFNEAFEAFANQYRNTHTPAQDGVWEHIFP